MYKVCGPPDLGLYGKSLRNPELNRYYTVRLASSRLELRSDFNIIKKEQSENVTQMEFK